MVMTSVIFLCTGNICRSPMAEALLNAQLDQDEIHRDWQVSSAGTWATDGNAATGHAIDEMAERGIDLRRHRARQITPRMMAQADLVLAMTNAHAAKLRGDFPDFAAKVYLLSQMVGQTYDVADPYGGGRQVYARTARELERLIDGGYPRIVQLAEGSDG